MRLTALVMAIVLQIAAFDFSDPFGLEGKVYNIYCCDEAFLDVMETWYPDYERAAATEANGVTDGAKTVRGWIGDVEVRWTILCDDPEEYQAHLDERLIDPEILDQDDRVDLFLIDGATTSKYCSEDADVALKLGDIGLKEEQLSGQYPITRELVTDASGSQRASTWQVPVGAFVYRRSIARAALGYDSPEQVQKAVETWPAIEETAETLQNAGYQLFAAADESFEPYFYRMGNWVDELGTITVNDAAVRWVELAGSFARSGYADGMRRFTDGWVKELTAGGPETFGFFLTAPEIAKYLLCDNDAAAGDYGICAGPGPFFEGGLWLCAAKGSDNTKLTKEILQTLTCDQETLKRMAETSGELVNHMGAMDELAGGGAYKSDIFGGENDLAVLASQAGQCSADGLTYYDRALGELFRDAFLPYFEGDATEAEAIDVFYREAITRYPDLTDNR